MAASEAADGRRRIALLIEYDGTAYAGSQFQLNAPTVQGVLEAAIERTTGELVRPAFAGRTDAGAHARGQVASFVTESRLEAPVIERALNAWLPRDVAVLEAADAPIELDVRRHARRRHYRYLVENRRQRPALDRGRAWHLAAPLDVDAMSRAARRLLGRHDFAAFGAAPGDERRSTIRDLFCFDVSRDGTLVIFDVVANAFLHHQVRRMVGALARVGQGKLDEEGYAGLLQGPPGSAGPAAPAAGLYLMGVEYEAPLFNAALDSRTAVC